MTRTSRTSVWRTATVDPAAEHFALSYNGDDSLTADRARVARLGPLRDGKYDVEFILDPRARGASGIRDAVVDHIEFYLHDKGEANPWGYAQYHCSTGANLYGPVHWTYFPEGVKPVSATDVRQMRPSSKRWWRKPLVVTPQGPLPAELVILRAELGVNESGAWLNSRGRMSGAVDLRRNRDGFRTKRDPLPAFVNSELESLYRAAGVARGAPDLVLWHNDTAAVRFIEVKWRGHDTVSAEQETFLKTIADRGLTAKIIEWQFESARSRRVK